MAQPTWKDLFISVGIKDDAAEKYAEIFDQQQMSRETLVMLDRQTLTELGITVIGDALSILRLAKSVETQATTSQSVFARTPSAKLPTLSSQMTHPQFRKFSMDWKVFVDITGLPPSQHHTMLYSCGDDEVQTAIINMYPDFFELPADSLLGKIEQVVTEKSNPTVHRMNFHNLMQENLETVQNYTIRLKSAAKDCEFSCPKCKEDISDTYITDQFIRGLSNDILQTDILAKADTFKKLEDMIKHAESFEAAVRDQTRLGNPSEIQAVRLSTYRRNKASGPKPTAAQNRPAQIHEPYASRASQQRSCSGCGSKTHSNRDRATACPAWGKTCDQCHKVNHFARVCRSNQAAAREITDYDEIATLMACIYSPDDAQCGQVTASPSPTDGQLDAILQPYTISSANQRGKKHNFQATEMKIFPDSGASICLAGYRHLSQMGLATSELIPCKKVITAVGGFTFTCHGWLPIEFTVAGISTRQPLYFCDTVNKIYFSRRGCIDVGILSPNFPLPSHMPSSGVSSISPEDQQQSCDAASAARSSQPVTDTEPSSRPLPQRPAKIPYPPSPDNIPKLEKYLLDSFRESAFNCTPPFPHMPGPAAHIHLQEDAIPKARHTPIPVPFHLKSAVKAGLDNDVKRGIITPVPMGTPTDWCSVMVVTAKKDGSPRRTVDFQYLNSQCKRETHHTASPFHLACQIPPHTRKTVLDAVDGYHAIQLDEESQPLTTFITEWGRYYYRRIPQGFLASGDIYTRRYDEIIQDFPRKVKIVDDTLLYDDDVESAFFHTFDYLTLCAQNGIVFNESKFQFCRDEVKFGGLTITASGVSPSNSMLDSIDNFPSPKSITDARSWFGLVNQVAWAYSLSPVMQPFRDLLKPEAKFYWDDQLEETFAKSKLQILSLVREGISAFDINRNTCLAPDWSQTGMGFLLLQQYCQCDTKKAPVCCPDGWKLVFAGSRFCTPAESRYAPIEGEAAAIAWSLEKCRMFILGCPSLIVTTDHQPLVAILGQRSLADVTNPRLFKIKERTLRYRFSIQHNPGRWQRGPDAMSRNPSDSFSSCVLELSRVIMSDPQPHDHETADEIEASIQAFACEAIAQLSDDIGSITHAQIKAAAHSDPDYMSLIQIIRTGFPATRHMTDPKVRQFWEVRTRLSVEDDIALLNDRIIVPAALRKRVLQCLHSAHQGVTSMRARANCTVYWPGMNASIRNFRECCIACRTVAPSLPQEPLMPSPQPEWPFQAICMDFLETLNHSYLACADRYSGWLIVYKITPDTRALKSACRAIFSTYGAPEELSSDGGTMFTSHDFQAFLQDWGVEHRLSSAHYPQSNGRAELAVKTAKRILMGNTGPSGNLDNDKFARAIMEYRNTPLPDGGPSPAQLLLHRQIRDFLPSHPSLLKPHVQWIAAAKRREKVAAAKTCRLAERYNLHAKNLPPLQVGQHVVLQNQYGPRMRRWDRTGRIVECLGPRQYRIRLDGSGRITIRNRRFLRLTHTQGAPNPPNNPPPAPGLLLAQPAAPQQHPPVVPPNPPRPQSLGTRSHQPQSLARVARPALPQHLPQRPALPQRQPQHPTLVPQQRPHAPLPTTRSAPAQPAGMVRPQPPIMGHPLVTPPSTPRAGPPVSPSSQPRSPAPYSRPPMPRVLPAMNLQIPQSTPHVPSLPVTRSGKLPLALRRLQDFNVPGNSE